MHRRHILFAEFVARMEDTRLPKCLMFGEIIMLGGAGWVGVAGKIVDRVPPGRRQSFRYQRRPVDDCNPGRGGMSQDGGTRDGTFHGKNDRCRESQGQALRHAVGGVASSSYPELILYRFLFCAVCIG